MLNKKDFLKYASKLAFPIMIQNLIGTENLPILFITNALFFMILSSLTFLITTIKSKKMIQMTQNIIEQ